MKKLCFGVILLSFLFLSACGEQRFPSYLQAADSLISISPDSAIALLELHGLDVMQEKEYVQMRYYLLLVKGRDKAFIRHTSDSLINVVLSYYINKSDRHALPEAYYYAGRVYSDLGDAPKALACFQKAEETLDAASDYNLARRIQSQIGTQYLYQDTYELAPEAFDKAYQYSLLAHDSVGMIYNLRDIARTFHTLQQSDSATHYYRKAYELSLATGNIGMKSIVSSEFSGFLSQIGKHQEAFYYLSETRPKMSRKGEAPRYSVMASYYYHNNELDSAFHYYSQLTNYSDYIYKQRGYKGLAEIADKRGEHERSIAYFRHYLMYADSLRQLMHSESIRKSNALYNYQLRERENHQLQSQVLHQKIYLFLFIGVLAVMIALFFVYREYSKRKEQMYISQQKKIQRIQKEQYQRSQAFIAENELKIKTLEDKLREAKQVQDDLQQELILAQKEYLEVNTCQVKALHKTEQQAIKIFMCSDVYRKFVQAHGKLSEDDWSQLIEYIDATYPNFIARLLELYPMKELEIRVCILLKMNLPLSQISEITIKSKQAITSIRKRLYEKVYEQKGTPEQWDNLVKTL